MSPMAIQNTLPLGGPGKRDCYSNYTNILTFLALLGFILSICCITAQDWYLSDNVGGYISLDEVTIGLTNYCFRNRTTEYCGTPCDSFFKTNVGINPGSVDELCQKLTSSKASLTALCIAFGVALLMNAIVKMFLYRGATDIHASITSTIFLAILVTIITSAIPIAFTDAAFFLLEKQNCVTSYCSSYNSIFLSGEKKGGSVLAILCLVCSILSLLFFLCSLCYKNGGPCCSYATQVSPNIGLQNRGGLGMMQPVVTAYPAMQMGGNMGMMQQPVVQAYPGVAPPAYNESTAQFAPALDGDLCKSCNKAAGQGKFCGSCGVSRS